jgi:putative iron-only hydrogenase system regulator
MEGMEMPKRLGVVGIVVENTSAAADINAILHEFGRIIVGRMGIPYRERGLAVISLIVDGTVEDINALTGQLGRVPGTSVKTALSREGHVAPRGTSMEV